MLDSTNRQLIEAGAALHLLHKREKRPIGDAWSSAPRHTLEELQSSYHGGENIGLRCGEISKIGDNYLHVIDLDVRDESLAREAHTAMLGLIPEAAEIPTVISGSGGSSRHFYIVTDKPFRSRKLLKSKEKGAWEIELFGTGKQVAIPPSIHPNGKPYVWKRPWGAGPYFIASPIVATWGASADDIDDLLGGDDELRTIHNMQPLTDLPLEEIEDTLANLPLPAWCEDREGWLNVGMALHHQFEGSKEGYNLWVKFSKQSKKFEPVNQKKTWESFGPKPRPFRFATLIQAAKLAQAGEGEALFDEAVEGERPARISEREKKLIALNKRHAIAFIKGKAVALTFREDDIDFGKVDALHTIYENVRQATERGTEPISKWWMRHKDRRTYYGGVAFRPGLEVPADTYNLWRGFSVEPNPEGSCQRFLDHLFENICQRRQKDYDYLIGWLAHMIQKPWKKPEVAVVLRGEKGVGKDVVAVHLGKLFKAHYVKISQMNHLTGTFNAHQEKALLIHVEEAIWAGDKKAEGPLKSLITSPTSMIEPKGINAFSVDSCSRVFITSNESWVVPATKGERRFAIFNVGKAHMQDRPYFKAMTEELEAGGYGALLHFLKTYDISGFDVGVAPSTEGLADQKVAGLKGHEAFWQEILDEGVMQDREHFDDADWSTDPICVPVDKLYARYENWWNERRHMGHGTLYGTIEFGRLLSEMCPSRQRLQRGRHITRFTVHRLPSLPACRSEFETYIGSTLEWSEIPTDVDVDDLL